MRLQRRGAAYNIDYAALNDGGSDFEDDAGNDGDDISAGEESLFKMQDPALLRNATLETECAPAKVQKREMETGKAREEEDKGMMASSFFVVPPLFLNLLSLFSSPLLKNNQHRRCPRPQSPWTGSRSSKPRPS